MFLMEIILVLLETLICCLLVLIGLWCVCMCVRVRVCLRATSTSLARGLICLCHRCQAAQSSADVIEQREKMADPNAKQTGQKR